MLRYRKTPIVLLVIYLITLIVPWVLTCVLARTSSYHDQRGRMRSFLRVSYLSAITFISVLRSISSIITIPITSTILSYAAVTYAQNTHLGQRLSAAQLFALSDRGWTDVSILWRSRSTGRFSPLLWLGAALVLIGSYPVPTLAICSRLYVRLERMQS